MWLPARGVCSRSWRTDTERVNLRRVERRHRCVDLAEEPDQHHFILDGCNELVLVEPVECFVSKR